MPSALTDSPDNASQFARSRRTRLACARCQTRKIKCDGKLPQCSGCIRASAECTDGKKVPSEGAISRKEAAALYGQLNRLQAIVQERCPDALTEQLHGATAHLSAALDTPPRSESHLPPGAVEQHHSNTSKQPASFRQPRETAVGPENVTQGGPSHEIGLIPLTSGVNKYVGPSSGFSFAKLLFAKTHSSGKSAHGHGTTSTPASSPAVSARLLFKAGPSALPDTAEEALQLSSYYFKHVQVRCPFLHQPTYVRLVHEFYAGQSLPATDVFQLTMVLAISVHHCARGLRPPYSGDSLCARAMLNFDRIDFQNSLAGVQSLLLIMVFTWYSPYIEVNPWYLNYQCLAACVDLGLQRDVPTSSSCTPFDREMRTRAFWSIYIVDRDLATRLGRPIGLRDEGCDLRFPAALEDDDLDVNMTFIPATPSTPPGVLACSRILIQMSLLNSEMKYIIHSITTNTPRYTYPQIPDLEAWQRDIHSRLQKLESEIPRLVEAQAHLSDICRLRCHELVMMLFRPSPRFRKPTKAALLECQRSAEAQIRLFKRSDDQDELPSSWTSIHAICLAAITLLYSIWSEPSIASAVKIDVLMDDLRSASNLLSSIGEYWPEAKNTRAHLEQLSSSTLRWLLDLRTNYRPPIAQQSQSNRPDGEAHAVPSQQGLDAQLPELAGLSTDWDWPALDDYFDNGNLATFVGAPDPFTADFSLTIDGLFSDYQPTFDFIG